jgi:RND family efflux transporter MFP subunit
MTRVLIKVLTLGLLAEWALPLQAQTSAPLDCLLEPNRVIDVSSAVRGVLSSVNVDRGDLIEEDQVIATLDSAVEQAAMELAQARARANAEVQADQINAEFAERRRDRFGTLYDRSAISTDQLDESKTIAQLRELEAKQSRENQHLAELEAKQAQEILARHVIRSPVRGVVVQRYLSPGESAEDRPILRVAEIQTLRAEAIIPVAQFGTIQVGQRAIIVPEEPLTGHYVGTVSIVDRVADAASGTFRARVLLDNPDYALPSGLRCAVRFLKPGESIADNVPAAPASRPLSRAALSTTRPRDLASAPSSTSPR